MIDDADLTYLRRCADLAEQALEGGNGPFGSLVVLDGEVRFEDHNRETETGDATRHPEFEIARWAAGALTPEERDRAVVYTSGEHCAMCSAAHAWVGLGRIVYAVSSAQLDRWRAEWGLDSAPGDHARHRAGGPRGRRRRPRTRPGGPDARAAPALEPLLRCAARPACY